MIEQKRDNVSRSKSASVWLVMLGLVIVAMFNLAIYQKEQIIANGQIVYLELAPVDPRSLMQGDYMRLHFALQDQVQNKYTKTDKFKLQIPARGFIIFTLDDLRVAKLARVDKEKSTQSNEFAIAYQHDRYSVDIHPDSFLFQEGKAALYSKAKYGVFKFDQEDNKVLIGLADEKRQIIE